VNEAVGWAGVAAMVLVSFIGGRFALAGQRQQALSQERASKMQGRTAESRLALDMAIETRDRLDMLEDWEDQVVEWWNEDHRPVDEARDRALRRADPAAFQNLPPLTPMPRPKRRKDAT